MIKKRYIPLTFAFFIGFTPIQANRSTNEIITRQLHHIMTLLRQPKTMLGVAGASTLVMVSFAIYKMIKGFRRAPAMVEKADNIMTFAENALRKILNTVEQEGVAAEKTQQAIGETTKTLLRAYFTVQKEFETKSKDTPEQPFIFKLLDYIAQNQAQQQLIVNLALPIIEKTIATYISETAKIKAATEKEVPAITQVIHALSQNPAFVEIIKPLISHAIETYAKASKSNTPPQSLSNNIQEIFTGLRGNTDTALPIIQAVAYNIAAGYASKGIQPQQKPAKSRSWFQRLLDRYTIV